MFKNTYQSGLLSIFYSCGSNPLAIWDMEVQNGHIKRLTDNEVNSIVLEIVSSNVATTFISCPKRNQVLGIRLPFLVMIVKNLKRYFSFEITILDDKNMRRRFRISNFQSTTKIKPFCTTMPIGLSSGWNQIQFNLADFTRRAYGTQFIETLRVQVHANARLRRIYFSERLYTDEELPQDYKLYLPLERKLRKTKPEKKDNVKAVKSAPLQQSAEEKAEPPPEQVAVSVHEPPKELESKVSAATVTPTITEAGDEKAEVEGVPVGPTLDYAQEATFEPAPEGTDEVEFKEELQDFEPQATSEPEVQAEVEEEGEE
ncbi:cilia- and flagella-associated protein 20-like [Pararge aegeria]|uniref:Jg19052 protein n=1 Tax=Pararge aegeria aegeria TaxID=348720 RepID=A0A8S4RL93_9NEOP|nr:cilia- and flagella-associated protein 20-like [Pararge aegeria]CAH2236854.1 jg19052 [Pararge aegeria aegeria]